MQISPRARYAIKAVCLLVTIVGAGQALKAISTRYRIGIDLQTITCLPTHFAVIRMRAPAVVRKGDLVAFHTSRATRFFPESTLLGKRVAGLAGDRYEVRNDEFYINGVPERYLTLCKKGVVNKLCANRKGVVPQGQMLVLADHPFSWDSRYWGPTPIAGIVGTIVWPSIPDPGPNTAPSGPVATVSAAGAHG